MNCTVNMLRPITKINKLLIYTKGSQLLLQENLYGIKIVRLLKMTVFIVRMLVICLVVQ